jgi:hypothetical protein
MGDAIRKVMERFPAFAWVVVIVGAFWAVWTYQTTAWIDARKPFLEKQLLFCIETVQTVAKVATTTNAKAFEEAKDTFQEFYWGRLAMVEDEGLAKAMVTFQNLLRDAKLGDERRELKGASLGVAHACRELIQKGWDIGLGRLPKGIRPI